MDVKVRRGLHYRTQKGVSGRRPGPSKVAQKTSRMKSKKKPLNRAIGRPHGSSQGKKSDCGLQWGVAPGRSGPRADCHFKMQVPSSPAGSFLYSVLSAQCLYFTVRGQLALTSLYF